MKTALFALALALIGTTASAQVQRNTPGTHPGQQFVEVADPGAPGDFAIFALNVTPPRCGPVNPYAEAKPAPLVAKGTPDILIYDKATGNSLFVITSPFPGLGYITESFKFVTLHEGTDWTVADLDGDGNDDLIGYAKATGEVVRAYRKDASAGRCQ